jgi:hypothetical protein
MVTITAKQYRKLKKKNKFNAKKTRYNGHLYDSKYEAEFAKGLDILKGATNEDVRVEEWTRQLPFDIVINGKKVGRYICDFKVIYANGRVRYIDTKGYDTELSKFKRKCVEACFSNVKIEVIHKKS